MKRGKIKAQLDLKNFVFSVTYVSFKKKHQDLLKKLIFLPQASDKKSMEGFKNILKKAISLGASDIHLRVGSCPIFRVNRRKLISLDELGQVTKESMLHFVKGISTPQQIKKLKAQKELDVSFGVENLGRFRINIYLQRGLLFMAIRHIPSDIPAPEDLNLPDILNQWAHKQRGLILVTGATGSGKTTTSLSLLDQINSTRSAHIVCIEDPIEFLIREKMSIISQREVGQDTNSFAQALRGALRQDPDVIFVGEMRDIQSVKTVLTAAETGHLVISTLHTINSTETINRILSDFGGIEQAQIRNQLASVLVGIVSQRLIPINDGKTLTPITEILIATERVRNLIKDSSKTHLIPETIRDSEALGMHSFDKSLFELVEKDVITFDTALKYASNPTEFKMRHIGFEDNTNTFSMQIERPADGEEKLTLVRESSQTGVKKAK